MDYTQINTDDERSMLATIGVERLDELFAPIPAAQRLDRDLDLPAGCSELELLADANALAARVNPAVSQSCFLGCGAYDHFIPTLVDHLAMRGEFLTAYTPYQAEASQGTLQAFYEFQTMICQLTGMEIANASLYEAASAAAEGMLMARNVNGRSRVVVAGTCHPDTLETMGTYAKQQRIEVTLLPSREGRTDIAAVREALGEDVSAVLVPFPNFFGQLEALEPIASAAREVGALTIVQWDPIAAGLYRLPGDLGADIVVGEGQALGIPLQYGGPYLGFFAARAKFLRKMPGRVVGEARDATGRRGFALVLQTREQHIKRDRATSNVCTNQGLMAMRATVYMAAMGRTGLQTVARQCLHKAHYTAKAIAALPDYGLRFKGPFFKEFVVQTTRPVPAVLAACSARGILAGVPTGRWFDDLADCFTVAVTEKRTRAEIDALVDALRDAG